MDPRIWPFKKQDDQLEHTYSSYVRIQDVALKTCQRRWMIGRSGERGSGISVLAARHDDDDELYHVISKNQILNFVFPLLWTYYDVHSTLMHKPLFSQLFVNTYIPKQIRLFIYIHTTSQKYLANFKKKILLK